MAVFNSASPVEIILNVYDLNPQANQNCIFGILGIGFYHTGIEINGTEYAYGGNNNYTGSGVFTHQPLQVTGSDAVYKESFLLGTIKNQSKLQQVLDEVKDQFRANQYNMIYKNCNHFTEAFTLRLLDKRIPSYINKAAKLGYYFSCVLPTSIKGLNPIPSQNNNNQSNGDYVGVEPQSIIDTTHDSLDSQRVPFSGKGYTIADFEIDDEAQI